MPDVVNNGLIEDAVVEALQLDLAFLTGPGHARHVPFAVTPSPISAGDIGILEATAPLLGRLTQSLAEQTELIQALHAPLAEGEPFFAELLSIHRELHGTGAALPRMQLLLQRSDFMCDGQLGPRLVECNSIAAGMAPFGERIQRLHQYLLQRWPGELARYSPATMGRLLPNPATERMADALAQVARRVRAEHGDEGAPAFLMVVQENEDNIFDQRLLERALQVRGVATFRRTFRQLHAQLSTGRNERLLLEGAGAVDLVYLRAGYQYQDYIATDLDTRRCCDALRATRIFIERHRVAVNATVAQQLATSKRMQQYLSSASSEEFSRLGFSGEELYSLRAVFAEMKGIDTTTAAWLREEGGSEDWVLKNQGEGGGHCLFDRAILPRLESLSPGEYPAWTLMRRLRPVEREVGTLIIREGRGQRSGSLVSEVGLFTAHLEGRPVETPGAGAPGYIGYLVRSKPADVTEGGVHSGFGMLDSLMVCD